MANTIDVVVSGSSIITFPNFGGQNYGNVYVANATPDRVSEASFVFGKDAVVVFEFSQVTDGTQTQNGFKSVPDEVSGNSRLLKITVYENAAAYNDGLIAYEYQPQNRDGTNLSNSSDRYGDTYLAFQTNSFADQNRPPIRHNGYDGEIPRLGQEMFIMPGVDLYQTLVVDKQSFSYSNVQNFDYNGDGSANTGAEVGNGFFNGVHSNQFVEKNIICFAEGTMIATQQGLVAVEDLRVGMMVLTKDHGYQPIRWIGAREIGAAELRATPEFAPVRIRAGALGGGLPEQDLRVSPQHRVLVRSPIAERMTGAQEVLVAARHLVDDETILVETGCKGVTYFHILFDAHEVIFSNGAATESLFTGRMALQSLTPEARREIEILFPEICAPGFMPVPARAFATGRVGRRLLGRHRKNHKMLYAA